jgi:hypothetical protein
MRPSLYPSARRRAASWLWAGPVGHLLGGSLDFAAALARYLLARARAWLTKSAGRNVIGNARGARRDQMRPLTTRDARPDR